MRLTAPRRGVGALRGGAASRREPRQGEAQLGVRSSRGMRRPYGGGKVGWLTPTSWSCEEIYARKRPPGDGGRQARGSASCWLQAMRIAGAVHSLGSLSRPRGGNSERRSSTRRGGSPTRRERRSSRTASAPSPVARGSSQRACGRRHASARLTVALRAPRLRPGAADPRQERQVRRRRRASPSGAGQEGSGAPAPA